MNLVELSKEISYALRHAPWEYELELDELGFVPIAQLLHALNESCGSKGWHTFFVGNDKVWLCKEMPKDCLSIFTPKTLPYNTAV